MFRGTGHNWNLNQGFRKSSSVQTLKCGSLYRPYGTSVPSILIGAKDAVAIGGFVCGWAIFLDAVGTFLG